MYLIPIAPNAALISSRCLHILDLSTPARGARFRYFGKIARQRWITTHWAQFVHQPATVLSHRSINDAMMLSKRDGSPEAPGRNKALRNARIASHIIALLKASNKQDGK
jgi:hypothetical protein